jgi:hypothetical protein
MIPFGMRNMVVVDYKLIRSIIAIAIAIAMEKLLANEHRKSLPTTGCAAASPTSR